MNILRNKIKIILKQYIKKEIIGVVFTIVYSMFTFVTPIVSSYLVDEVIPTKSLKKLFVGVGMFVIICVLQPIIGCIKDYIFIDITENITFDIRKKLYKKIVHADFEFLDQAKSGDLVSIIMGDGRAISEFISNLFAILLKNALTILMIVIGMISIDWKTSLIVFLAFTFMIILQSIFNSKIRRISNEIQINYDNMCTCISQTNSMISYIKLENEEKSAILQYSDIIKKMKKDNIILDRTMVLINNITSIIIVVCVGIIYVFGALAVMNGKMTIGNVIAMGLYFQMLAGPLYEVMGIGIDTNVLVPIVERIERYEALTSEKLGECELVECIKNISIEHLEYSRKGKKVLSDINIRFPQNGIVYIVGESGTGKSTLLKLMMGMYKVDDNMITYNGIDINKYDIMSLRERISYVPQECQLFNRSVMYNLTYGVDKVKYSEIIELCKILRIHETIEGLEYGYDSIITEKTNLSGGEKQRILLARAILKNSDVIMLDEPLASLDEENIGILGNVISKIAQTRLIIMVTHQEHSSITPNQVLVINNLE